MKWKRIAKGHYECGDYTICRATEVSFLCWYVLSEGKDSIIYEGKTMLECKLWLEHKLRLLKGGSA